MWTVLYGTVTVSVFGRKCGEQVTSYCLHICISNGDRLVWIFKYENVKMEDLRLNLTWARVDFNLSNRGEIWSRGSASTGVANSRYDSRKRHRVLIDPLISVKIVGWLRWYNSATNSVIDENCGSWWPKFCYGNIEFTLEINISIVVYLFYARFLEYSSIHTCTRRGIFFHTRLLIDWTVYIHLFSRLRTLIPT